MIDNPAGMDLDDDRVNTLRHFLSHPSWQGTFIPAIDGAIRNAYRLLAIEPAAREKAGHPESDALLRARIQVLELLLELGPAELRDDAQKRALRAQMDAQESEYTDRAALGLYGPTM